jgi:hypothetical protein
LVFTDTRHFVVLFNHRFKRHIHLGILISIDIYANVNEALASRVQQCILAKSANATIGRELDQFDLDDNLGWFVLEL